MSQERTRLVTAEPDKLFPRTLGLYQSICEGVQEDERIGIAQQATALRENINNVTKSVQDLEGGDLSIRDQERLIGILEAELEKRRQQP